jgi:hypothetical protein
LAAVQPLIVIVRETLPPTQPNDAEMVNPPAVPEKSQVAVPELKVRVIDSPFSPHPPGAEIVRVSVNGRPPEQALQLAVPQQEQSLKTVSGTG